MGRKKNPASEMDVAEKMTIPLTQNLCDLITDVNALKDFLGVSAQAINQYKLGVSRPSLENLCKIADFYGTSVDYLLGRTDIKLPDANLQAAAAYTGLSEAAATKLHQFQYDARGNPDNLGVDVNGYTIGHVELVNCLLESRDFAQLFNEIGFYLIFGGALPEEAYTSDVKELSYDEHMKFYKWANNMGLEVVKREEASELHLQLAAEKLKTIYREVLKGNRREE